MIDELFYEAMRLKAAREAVLSEMKHF